MRKGQLTERGGGKRVESLPTVNWISNAGEIKVLKECPAPLCNTSYQQWVSSHWVKLKTFFLSSQRCELCCLFEASYSLIIGCWVKHVKIQNPPLCNPQTDTHTHKKKKNTSLTSSMNTLSGRQRTEEDTNALWDLSYCGWWAMLFQGQNVVLLITSTAWLCVFKLKKGKHLTFFFFRFQFCALNSNFSPEGSTDTPLTSGISTNSAGCEHILALGCFSTPNVRKMITGLCSFFFQIS